MLEASEPARRVLRVSSEKTRGTGMVEAGGHMKLSGTGGASSNVEVRETRSRRILLSAKRIVLLMLLGAMFLIYYLLDCLQRAVENL
jgi:hypothetical protein